MSRARLGALLGVCVVSLSLLFLGYPKSGEKPATDTSQQQAQGGERYVHDAQMKETMVDVFPGMDGPNLNLTQDDIRGRIVWNLWCGDTGLMWDYLAQNGFGTSDLLKTLDSRGHNTRFTDAGIINQPGFMAAPKADQYGIWLDVPKPGDPDGQMDQKVDFYTYGRSSGAVGLRVFNNPKFDDAAKAEWMKHVKNGVNEDYYNNPHYYNDPKLVRPYTVGMACAFCHVSFDPIRPPADPENPKWENLNDYVGAQYLKVWEVFVPRPIGQRHSARPNDKGDWEKSFVWQLIHSNPQGTLDTSFIATDYLNNPGTMNGVYSLVARLSRAQNEHLTGGALDLRNVKADMAVPRVLKQGDDSVGFEAALSRVYVNIGEDWPEWHKHFNPLVGGIKQTPVPVKTMQMTSPHWNWSEERSPQLAGYLVKVSKPLLLKDAPGGAKHLTATPEQLNRGKIVFAENCARCHSSKQPPEGTDPKSDAGKAWFRQHVMDPDFFTADVNSDPKTWNFLADERRHPVTEIGTNSTRAAGTNATVGHIWDNFSSETYKNLAPVGKFNVENPWAANGQSEVNIPFPGEPTGPGYYRPPSLVSLWTSAPYLHNNTVGEDFGDPTVDGRMRAFQDGIERMLLIQPRKRKIWTTTEDSYINVPLSYLPKILQDLIIDPKLKDDQGNLTLGPIPKGTPINLLANTNLEAPLADMKALTLNLIPALIKIRLGGDAATAFKPVVPYLLKVNKCPDFIEDKGHMFGTDLPVEDKKALIELLKTF